MKFLRNFLVILICISTVTSLLCSSITDRVYATETTTEEDSGSNDTIWPTGPTTDSEAAIIMEASTGAILYSKNIDEQMYPASITKIMTVLLALENCELDETVTFSKQAVYGIERDSSHIARDVGEQLTLEQCLYAILLESANEVSYAVAEHVAGSMDNFSKMMNEKAASLGCTNTHFVNSHGCPNEEHYTTAHDMALITQEAMKNSTFRAIAGTSTYQIPPTNKNDETCYLCNHHKMKEGSEYEYEGFEGGKTGYTTVARATLVTFAKRGDLELICVVMKATGSNHYVDTTNLLNYGFDNFKIYNIADNQSNLALNQDTIFASQSPIFGDISSFLSINSSGNIVLPNVADFSDAVPSLTTSQNGGKNVGLLSYSYNDQFVGSTTVDLQETSEDTYQFQTTTSAVKNTNEDSKTETSILKINVIHIVIGIVAVILTILLGLFLRSIFFKNRRRKVRYSSSRPRRKKSKFSD